MIETIVRKERAEAGAGLRTVHLLEVVYRSWFDDVQDGDDVLAHACLAEELQQLELSQCAQAEH